MGGGIGVRGKGVKSQEGNTIGLAHGCSGAKLGKEGRVANGSNGCL